MSGLGYRVLVAPTSEEANLLELGDLLGQGGREGSDLNFPVVAKDDKELRDIIKEKTQLVSNSKSTPSRASPNKARGKPLSWASAEPQRAVLMDVESGLYPDFRDAPHTSSHNGKQSQVNLYRSTWKPRPTARA